MEVAANSSDSRHVGGWDFNKPVLKKKFVWTFSAINYFFTEKYGTN